MDPYLEDPQIWPGVHNAMVVYIRDYLQPLLRPRYIAAVEDRVFVEGPQREIIPDVWLRRGRPEAGKAVAVLDADEPDVVRVQELEIHETYVEILDRQSGLAVVTVIEVVSPSNKFLGAGRDSYLAKQKQVRGSRSHLVEIDLLRTGQHVLAVPEWVVRGRGPYDYLVCENRAEGLRDHFDLYARGLREKLPKVRIPLAGDDPDVPLDLQAVLTKTYEAGAYRDRLNYETPCHPPLDPDDKAWANELIRQGTSAPGHPEP